MPRVNAGLSVAWALSASARVASGKPSRAGSLPSSSESRCCALFQLGEPRWPGGPSCAYCAISSAWVFNGRVWNNGRSYCGFFLQEGEHGLAGLVAAADILQAGVLGGEGQSQLLGLLEIVVPGGAMESLLGKHLRAVCADLLEQGVPARQGACWRRGRNPWRDGRSGRRCHAGQTWRHAARHRPFRRGSSSGGSGRQVAFDEGRIGNRHFPLGEVSLHRSVQRLRHGGSIGFGNGSPLR